MSTHNIGFYEAISKIIPLLSSNTHLISSSEQVEDLTENKHILNKYTISLFLKILIL